MNAPIVSLQFVFFFKDVIDRPDILFADLNIKMANTFDAMPVITPTPLGFAPEIPMIYHRSESNEFACNISKNRLDFFVQRTSDTKSNEGILSDFIIKTRTLSDYIINKKEIIRFGMIGRCFIEDKTAIDSLKRRYFVAKKLPTNISELGLKFNNQSDFFGLKINDIIEISSDYMVINDNRKFGIFIQQDINNVPLEGVVLTTKNLEEVFNTHSNFLSDEKIKGFVK